MYRTLLVPLDGSAFAEHALPVALSIARRAGGTVNLVHVHLPHIARSAEQNRQYLEWWAKNISTVPVTFTLLEDIQVAERLATHAAESGTDLIVMSTHGRGGISRFCLGSVADELVRKARQPILLIRPGTTPVDLETDPEFRHVLIPLGGSAQSERVLESAAGMGRLMNARYSLLRVYGPPRSGAFNPRNNPDDGVKSTLEQLRDEAQDCLNRISQRLQGRGLDVHTHVVCGQDPASVIVETAQRLAVDLIALETNGTNGLRRILSGSVADAVRRGTSIPLLLHRSPVGDPTTSASPLRCPNHL